MFSGFYLSFPAHSSLSTFTFWLAVIGALLLFVAINVQIMSDLKTYRSLKRERKDDDAYSHYYFSFIGYFTFVYAHRFFVSNSFLTRSIVFGHGKPDNILTFTRYTTLLCCDGLFFVICSRLISILSCEYATYSSEVIAHIFDNPYVLFK